jgi:hypothetical protein
MVLYQGYSPIIGFNVSSGTTLLRWGSQKWTLGGQSYQSMGYRDTYTIRTSWSRRVSEGLIASLSLGYALGIDTATTTSVAAGTYTDSLLFFSKAPTLIGKRNLEILNSSSKGPEASARIGYQGQNWQISLSLNVSQQTALKKDFWSMDTSDYYWNLDTNAYRIDSQKKFHAVIPITDSIDVDFLLSDGLITTDQANYLLTYAATHPGAVTSGNMKAIVEGKMDIRSYRQSYQKASLTLSLGMGLTDNVSMDLSTTYMQKIYQNMSVSHPLYYASLSRSLSALCGFTYDF